uniref:Cytochrome c assembly protein domain-containing protein n=1 Tax=candidate division WOR-3 bacterium TaxID=2052148 RepID=A0A7C4CAQ9_UNCW3
MNQQLLLWIALAGYVAGGIASASRRTGIAIALSLVGTGAHLTFVFVRAAAAGVLPFASRFEAVALFALSIEACGLLLAVATKRHPIKVVTDFLGASVLALSLLVLGFQPPAPLNPILDSRWFASHILFAFAGYGVLVAGLVWSITVGTAGVSRRLGLAVVVLLGTGILLGAIWADESWGSYWSWDPKEAWALLTWMLVVTYLHVAGPRPKRWVSILFFALGNLAMLFTFVGINLLKTGLHRYG